MAKKQEKKIITRENWLSSFNIIGKAIRNDYTFKIDEKSERSAWIYSSMNLALDCGEKFGTVYANLMGGYSSEGESVIYAHGKNDDGSDDFENQIQVAWEDREDDEILESLGDRCFITVGLEKLDSEKTYYKKFLSAYDAIAYIDEHLQSGMVLNIKGTLRYSIYQDKVRAQKNITSIVISKYTESDADKFRATFTQSVLIDKYSAALTKDRIDKDKGVMYVNARVLDYLKEMGGIEVRGQYPFQKDFEFEMDFSDEEKCKKIVKKLFAVKKNVTQINFDGKFVSGGAVVSVSWDDVPDDIKELVDCGIYSKEEALQKCSGSGSSEERMILVSPVIRTDRETGAIQLQIFPDKYTDEDLTLDYLATGVEDGFMNVPEDEEVPFEEDNKKSKNSSKKDTKTSKDDEDEDDTDSKDDDDEDDSEGDDSSLDWLNAL